eukprot:CAMPEP_0177363416 /NCGR_PEP_ID=MMETSP0368-20130122/38238_1 /TAXON_ID=447022 ORGANISM="Scrippsiella hangoei-like, Strain SHHI-4" /NCGR_SAMPLE_ID=MMETSP0368 /ASSEMBLY_ACC=CAM_ASM_000363 /LENGTH=219 /DNA_ID=CAMNT_0018826195 /DNA_START=325 /DNA_END=983 /DNA_ORIENTATION=+
MVSRRDMAKSALLAASQGHSGSIAGGCFGMRAAPLIFPGNAAAPLPPSGFPSSVWLRARVLHLAEELPDDESHRQPKERVVDGDVHREETVLDHTAVGCLGEAWKGRRLAQILKNPDGHSSLPIWEGVVSRGEILYLPAGAIHGIWAEEDTVNVVLDSIDVGGLGPVSQRNAELMEEAVMQGGGGAALYKNLYRWFRNPQMRLQVFDGEGPVRDPNATA